MTTPTTQTFIRTLPWLVIGTVMVIIGTQIGTFAYRTIESVVVALSDIGGAS